MLLGNHFDCARVRWIGTGKANVNLPDGSLSQEMVETNYVFPDFLTIFAAHLLRYCYNDSSATLLHGVNIMNI